MKNELETINFNMAMLDGFGNGMSGNGMSGNGMSGNGISCQDFISDILEEDIKDIQRDL